MTSTSDYTTTETMTTMTMTMTKTTTQEPVLGIQGGADLHWTDYLVIAVYFAGILFVGLWSSKKSKGDSVSGYFLASRSMHWIPVGASLFASNIGSGHFVGLAGSGASSGIAIAGFEFNAMYILLILGWFFLPVYLAAGVNTMPEYLRKRFGGQRIRIYLSVLALILYIFTKISADLYAGALFIKQALGLDMYVSVVILLAIAALFTIAGGLTAVIWTDFVQTILMLIGSFVLTILSLIKVGGYKTLMDDFAIRSQPTNDSFIMTGADNVSCSAVTPYYKHLFRPIDDPELPWTGVLLGITITSTWYWCSDQVIVQRALSAKSLSYGKAGCLMCAIIKILPLYLLVLPGMAARVLWPNEIGCSNPDKCQQICGSKASCINIAYPLLVLRIMPHGATGLMLSVMMAALMSSLTSIFNSASTIFTIDIYTRFRKNASEIEQVIVGRIFVLVLVVVSILWIPIIQNSQDSGLFHYIQSVTSYLAPPVCAVYILAVFWGRINEPGAFWGLMSGLIIGMIRFVMEFSFTAPECGISETDPRPSILTKVHYLHFGILLFIITGIVTIAVSFMTKPIDEKHLYRLTFWTKFSEKVRIDIDEECHTKEGITNGGFVSGEVVMGTEIIDQNQYNTDLEPYNQKRKRILYTICCVGSESVSANSYDMNNENIKQNETIKLTKEEEAIRCANEAKETPVWQSINSLLAILVIAVASFFWGFYA